MKRAQIIRFKQQDLTSLVRRACVRQRPPKLCKNSFPFPASRVLADARMLYNIYYTQLGHYPFLKVKYPLCRDYALAGIFCGRHVGRLIGPVMQQSISA